LERYAANGAQHALRSKVITRDQTRAERQDLESEVLGQHHKQPRQGEPDHGTPVLECGAGEAAPAFAAADEVDVEEEADGKEGIRDCNGERGAAEAELEMPDEEPVEEGVEGGDDEEDVEGCGEDALGLDETFACGVISKRYLHVE